MIDVASERCGLSMSAVDSAGQQPFDPTIWRTVADSLVPGNPGGPLHSRTAAIKDLGAVTGHPVDDPVMMEAVRAFTLRQTYGRGSVGCRRWLK